MAAKKFAISVPQEVMDAVDEAAARQGLSRSAFIAQMLRRIARARSDADCTRRINAVFDDPEVAREQLETAHALGRRTMSRGSRW